MAEPFVAADELSDDCADHGEGACNLQAAEEIRQRIRKPDFGKFLPPSRMQDAAEIEQFLFDRHKSGDHIHDDRKKRDQERQQNFRREPIAGPNQQQRRNGHFWDDLQHNDLRIDHVTDDARIDDDDRQKYPDRRGEQETDDHFVEGNPRVIEIERVTRHRLDKNRRRRGKDEPRNMKNASQELPYGQGSDDRDGCRSDVGFADPHGRFSLPLQDCIAGNP